MPKKFINIRIFPALLLLTVFIVIACSTKKNTFSRRAYHNLTAHYNVYWNGKEALLEAEDELDKIVVDNFNVILPVYITGTQADAQSVTPLLDRAIEKGSKTILKHSMVFGGKEYVKWIDDAYLLIGKSYFYKQDYYSARRSFNFVMRNFDENDIKYDAMLWLAKTYIELEEFEKAEPVLNLIQKDAYDGKVTVSIEKELSLIYANYYIKQEKYFDAVEYLYAALDLPQKKQLKTRVYFILAQILQSEEDLAEASNLYLKVIRRNPKYDMAFQAKINLAMSYQSGGEFDKEDIIKILNKMLRDEKNKDYQDQIYYALAEIALRDNNDTLGIKYLRLSVKTSMANNYQKATSSLKLADIYFAIPNYENAQAYYDTAIQFLPEYYPNYKFIKLKTEKLSDLVSNLNTIHYEDSIQNVAKMPEEERNDLIDKIIEDLEEQERLRAEQEELAAQNAAFGAQTGFQPGFGTGGDGKWYFYNPGALSQGYTQFIQQWGRRKLEDLWRLRDKQIISFEPDEIEQVSVDTTISDSTRQLVTDPHNREYYLKDLPLSEEKIELSNQKIIRAYYNLGLIYNEGLRNPAKAISSFEEMLTRFPETTFTLKVYYQLYRLNLEVNNQERAEYYKTLIFNNYPDSDYAKIIEDPDYFKQLKEKESELAIFYSETYDDYLNERYFDVIDNADLAQIKYSDTASLIPKFQLLKALSIGKVDILDSLVVELKRIIKEYPDSEVKPTALDILNYIVKDNPEFADETTIQPVQAADTLMKFPYNYDPKATHLYMMLVKKQAVKLNPIKVKISDFNKKYFRLKDLVINSVLLDRNYYLITVGNFDDAQKALNYFNAIGRNRYVFSDLSPGNYEQYVISSDNYPIFYNDKNMDLYSKFFKKYYKTGK